MFAQISLEGRLIVNCSISHDLPAALREAAYQIAKTLSTIHNSCMRIIAGEFRGRKLLPPDSTTTRPITDRVKQSLFDVLTPLLPDCIVYDCFAGTGSLGLEAISRGAKFAMFFEIDRPALGRLWQNVQSLGVEQRCRLIASDVFAWFADAGNRPGQAGRADIVFLDPPYRFLMEKAENLRRLGRELAERHLAADGTVVFRHAANSELELPGLRMAQTREYGSMKLEFLMR